MVKSLLIISILFMIILFGCFVADDNILTKDNIFHPRYVVKCLPEHTVVKVAGYVQSLQPIVLVKGKDGYPLVLAYNGSDVSLGDEIVASGYYGNGLFFVNKMYNGGELFQNRYVYSLFVIPFIILVFFMEYKFKGLRFVKRD